MSEIQWHTFKNIGYLTNRLTAEEMSPIYEEIDEIQRDFEQAEPYNEHLVGHIKREFAMPKSFSHVEKIVSPYIAAYDQVFEHHKSFNMLNKNLPFKLSGLWVNFMRKGEFNPVHNHSGAYSFVIWARVPFNIEDEEKQFPNSSIRQTAHFDLMYLNAVGQVKSHSFPVDKTFEGTILVFPAEMNHVVYPFYTSDDYRVSVAGNFSLIVD